MDLSQYAELFLTESREHLSACNQLLLEWERSPDATEPVGELFRSVHTIKGMAATMGYSAVAELAHRTENLLDALRQEGQTPTQAHVDLLFRVIDRLEEAVVQAVRGQGKAVEIEELAAALDRAAAEVGRRTATPAAQPGAGAVAEPAPQPAAGAIAEAGPPAALTRLVRVALRPDAPLKGARAAVVVRRAEALGHVADVRPPLVAFEADDFEGRFTLRLATAESAEAIVATLRAAGEVESVAIADEEGPEAAEAGAEQQRARDAARTRHLRVDIRHLDTLMNLIGELVIGRGRLTELAGRRKDVELDDALVAVSRLTSELQAEIVQARLTPVWQVFDRFPRLVRDVARQLHKDVTFRIEGKEIELDRAILDEMHEPLLHLLRNAVDHGIEAPDERRQRRKPREGQLVLAAARERNSVTVTVSDDGRGIDRRAVLERARREGLVERHVEALSDDLLLRVLARPGFSTATAVSQVSGRGVGIDIVLTRLRALGGSLEIQTDVGRGTTFRMRLPVTLAILRALLARIGSERYALPLTHVAETLELDPDQATSVGGRDALMLRDRVLPLVHLDRVLGVDRGGQGPPSRRPVIVLELGERRTGVVVDRLLGQQEIVVKGFRAPRGTLPMFSGATVLGDGSPVLILDAGGLL